MPNVGMTFPAFSLNSVCNGTLPMTDHVEGETDTWISSPETRKGEQQCIPLNAPSYGVA